MDNLPLLLGAALVGGGAVLQLYGTYRALQIARGARRRRPRDATGEAGLLPADLGRWHDELRGLGFARLGESALDDIPGERQTHYSWVLVDETGTVEVELVASGASPLLAFVTTFGDGAAVQTMLPIGERMRRDDFVSIVEPHSVATAVERHRAEVAAMAARHGRPLVVRTMADHLRHDATYRERHATRFLMRGLVRGSLKAWAVIAIAAFGVYMAFGPR